MVAAVTGDDEDNLVISLLAKQEFAVPRVVARVNNPKNEWMFNEMWGVDVSVSTPHLLTALVEEAVSVGSLVRLLSFEGGRARLSEATLHDESPADGKDIEELGFPRDSTVVAIIRDDHVIVPRGDTVLRAGDEVLVLTSPDAEDEVVRKLLGRSPPLRPEQRVGGVDQQHPAPLVAADALDHDPPARVDARQLLAAGEHGDGAAGAVGDGDLERRRPGAGHDLQALDLAADPDAAPAAGRR